jgi:hypothetical protein
MPGVHFMVISMVSGCETRQPLTLHFPIANPGS